MIFKTKTKTETLGIKTETKTLGLKTETKTKTVGLKTKTKTFKIQSRDQDSSLENSKPVKITKIQWFKHCSCNIKKFLQLRLPL